VPFRNVDSLDFIFLHCLAPVFPMTGLIEMLTHNIDTFIKPSELAEATPILLDHGYHPEKNKRGAGRSAFRETLDENSVSAAAKLSKPRKPAP